MGMIYNNHQNLERFYYQTEAYAGEYDVQTLSISNIGEPETVLRLLDDPPAPGVDGPEVHVALLEVVHAQEGLDVAAHVLGDVLR